MGLLDIVVTEETGTWFAKSRFEDKDHLKVAGFRWNAERRQWFTRDETVLAKFQAMQTPGGVAKVKKMAEQRSATQTALIAESHAADAAVDLPAPSGLSYLPFQRAGIASAIKRAEQHGGVLFGDDMGLGKAQPLDAGVLTPDGWVCMGDIRVGSRVFGSNGNPSNVVGVYPQGVKSVYRVEFSDGSSTECCLDHLWAVQTPVRKKRGNLPRVLTTSEIMQRGLFDATGNARHFIPMAQPVVFPEALLPLDPYLVGVLLGDGKLATGCPMISSADAELIRDITPLLPNGLIPTLAAPGTCDYRLSRPAGTSSFRNELKYILRDLGMRKRSWEKSVPDIYKFADIDQRRSLLAGLLDTDGSTYDGVTEFCSTSETLARDVIFLVQSLGGRASIRNRVTSYSYLGTRKQGRVSWRVNIALPAGHNPFRLERKRSAFVERSKYQPSRAMVAITYVGIKPCQCIRVDAPDSLYLTDNCIVTHNTIQGIGLINVTPAAQHILIVCPATLKGNWQRELRRWLVNAKLRVGMVNGNRWIGAYAHIVIINYDIVDRHVDAILRTPWDIVILDEAHSLKNPKAKRTRAVMGISEKEAKRENDGETDPKKMLQPRSPISAPLRVALTGTPIPNRPIEIFPILRWLAPSLFRSKFTFTREYCSGWDAGASNLDKLQRELRSTIMIRRRKVDVLTELPPKRRVVIEIDAEGLDSTLAEEAQISQRHLKDLESLRVAAELAKAGSDEDYRLAVEALKKGASVAFTEMSRVRHATALATVPYAIDHVMTALDGSDTHKVVVFGHHQDVIHEFLGAMAKKGIKTASITQAVPVPDRQAEVDRFQNDKECRVFAGGIQSAGVGITLTASDHVVFIEEDWVPGNISQAEDRCNRIGQRNSVLCEHLVISGSMAVTMAKRTVEKQKVIDDALDRAHGVLGGDEALEAGVPVVPGSDEAASESMSRQKIKKAALEMTREKCQLVQAAVKAIAALDMDRARELNGVGFSRIDGMIGHSLASAPYLTPPQAALGITLASKYRRQLEPSLRLALGMAD